MVCGFLIQPLLPSKFWVDATYTAIFTISALPATVLGSASLVHKLFSKLLYYNFLKTFGSACFLNFSASSHNKLQPRSIQCVFLSYVTTYKGYRCLKLILGKVSASRQVQFYENTFPYAAPLIPIVHDNLTSDILSLTTTSQSFTTLGSSLRCSNGVPIGSHRLGSGVISSLCGSSPSVESVVGSLPAPPFSDPLPSPHPSVAQFLRSIPNLASPWSDSPIVPKTNTSSRRSSLIPPPTPFSTSSHSNVHPM